MLRFWFVPIALYRKSDRLHTGHNMTLAVALWGPTNDNSQRAIIVPRGYLNLVSAMDALDDANFIDSFFRQLENGLMNSTSPASIMNEIAVMLRGIDIPLQMHRLCSTFAPDFTTAVARLKEAIWGINNHAHPGGWPMWGANRPDHL